VINRDYIFTLYSKGVRSITEYLEQMDKRIEDAEARVERNQQSRIDLLNKELTLARKTLGRQTEELREQRQLNHQLNLRIRELEREIERGSSVERDSHNSSLPPSLDPPWKKIKRTRSLRTKSGKKVGGQPGHKGSTLLQVAEPNEMILHRPTECAGCGEPLIQNKATACERRQVFDIADGRVTVTEHRAETVRCSSCGATTKAKFPSGVRAPVQYGPEVITGAVYLHLYQLIPVARTCETMRDLFGCHLSPATVQRAGIVCSGKLVRCEQRIKAAIRDSAVIGVDESGLRVAGGSGWVHVARTESHTHYAYDERRGKAAMDEIGILPQFKGTLVRDGFSSYKWYERCQHALCNVHVRRVTRR
jgi:transposase